MERDFTFSPDNWVIIELTNPDTKKPFHKVLAGTSGGYLYGDSWRLNSGIKKIEEADEAYFVYGYSGSIYRLWKGHEEIRMSISGILNEIIEVHGGKVVNMVDVLERYKNDG